ncbi:uncharacterized protein M421DRAFT_380130 [Didymella exigua CBS 183.55]|uniref:Uncharacterized protein n=1 Tax=Didymella exigua CBS 183.55 TaxID=1150837 RepID=A0A6A5R8V7_9PLEO|nr:uncharacterized protein M421DRAFT_380130 [Didymella exigua CBS 183.55]KAF1922247.1 hypothetical protein M421DRAFT_380130 [Didymella exigua CBS 183.55]
MYISSLEVTCLPVFVFLEFSSCVYAILEVSCVQRCLRLVEARLPRVLRLQYLQSPPSVQLSCVLACPYDPGPAMCFLNSGILLCCDAVH